MKQAILSHNKILGMIAVVGLLAISGCQSAESGGSFSGFHNPLGGIPPQSEPPISTLEEETKIVEDVKSADTE